MSIAADSSHYDYINYEKTNLAAKVHGFLQTTKNNRCFVLQDTKFVVLLQCNRSVCACVKTAHSGSGVNRADTVRCIFC
jgi:hypothetical protein